MKNLFICHISIILSILLLTGCATVQDRINKTEQIGIEKIYAYPYNKVFHACEDASVQSGWMIQESNYDKGYMYLTHILLFSRFNNGIKIKEIDSSKTIVKFLSFNSPFQRVQKQDALHFFTRLDNLLNRDQ